MQTSIEGSAFPYRMRGVSDGTVAGTHFFNDDDGAELPPGWVIVQQEDVSAVRIRFAPAFRIASLVMAADDTLTVNMPRPA
jgi:hypothetical protein